MHTDLLQDLQGSEYMRVSRDPLLEKACKSYGKNTKLKKIHVYSVTELLFM
jgi:hypothetical protein